MSTFVITKRLNDEYKFIFTSRKGNIIFTSLSYELKFECEEAIELLRNSIKETLFIKKKSTKGKFYFDVLLNDKIYATSRKFSTLLMLQKGIDGINKYLFKSEVLDFSNQDEIFQEKATI